MFATLQAKLYGWLAAAGALTIAIAYAFLRGRSWGKTEATQSINHQAQEARDAMDKVDNKPIDFDAAIERLHRRSKGPTP